MDPFPSIFLFCPFCIPFVPSSAPSCRPSFKLTAVKSQHIVLAESDGSPCQICTFLKYTARQRCSPDRRQRHRRNWATLPEFKRLPGTVVKERKREAMLWPKTPFNFAKSSGLQNLFLAVRCGDQKKGSSLHGPTFCLVKRIRAKPGTSPTHRVLCERIRALQAGARGLMFPFVPPSS